MRTRSGSDYNPATQPLPNTTTPTAMDMDPLEAALLSLDTTGPITNESLAQMLRGLPLSLTKKFQDVINRKDAQIDELRERVVTMEEKCDDLEQYSRRNTIRIRGVPEAVHEDTDSVVRELAARKLDVKLEPSNFVRSHRVGRKTEEQANRPRDIIARFTTHNVKVEILRNAKKLRGTNTYINEDVTKIRGAMASDARKLKRDGKIQDTWTRDGIIFTKDMNGSIKAFTAQRFWEAYKEKL